MSTALSSVLVRFTADISDMQRKMKEATASVRSVSAKVSSSGAAMGTAFAGMAAVAVPAIAAVSAALTALYGVVGVQGVKYNAMLEQSLISYETLLGTAEKAQAHVAALQKFAVESPFNYEAIDKASKLLLAMGVDAKNNLPYLESIGNAVSAVGGGAEELQGVAMAFGQMTAKGKISAEEMNQLAERGIPAWKLLADGMGKSVQEVMKMSENGKLFANEVIPLMINQMDEKFGGSLEKQSKTFNGMVSALKENLGILMAQIMEPTFNRLKEILPVLIEGVTKISQAFKQGGWEGVFEKLLPPSVAANLISGIKTISSAVDSIKKAFISNKDDAISAMDSMAKSIKPILDGIKTLIVNVTSVIKILWAEWGDELTTIFKILWKTVTTVLSSAIGVINGVIQTFIGLFTGNWGKMGEGLLQIWTNLWHGFVTLVMGADKLIVTAINTIYNSLRTWFTKISTDALTWGGNIVDGIISGISGKIEAAKQMASQLAASVKTAVTDFLDIHSPSKVMEIIGQNTVEGMIRGLNNKTPQLKGKAAELAATFRNTVEQQVRIFDTLGERVISALSRRYDEQERMALYSKDIEIEIARKATDEKIRMYDREYAAKLKLLDAETAGKLQRIQDEIDGINDQTDAEEKALREQEYQKRLSELKQQLAVEEGAEERQRIQDQINEEIARHERDQLLERREEQIDHLREEMEEIRRQAEDKRQQMEDELQRKKEAEEENLAWTMRRLEGERVAIEDHYKKMKAAEAIEAEARKLVLDKNQKELVTLLNSFAPQWWDAGKTFGEKIIEGISSTKQSINTLVSDILSLVGRARSAADSVGANTASLKGIPGLATGGTVVRSGTTLVGEKGPELLRLPQGASVIPLDHASSGGNVFHVTINGTNADEIWSKFERELQRRGGRF